MVRRRDNTGLCAVEGDRRDTPLPEGGRDDRGGEPLAKGDDVVAGPGSQLLQGVHGGEYVLQPGEPVVDDGRHLIGVVGSHLPEEPGVPGPHRGKERPDGGLFHAFYDLVGYSDDLVGDPRARRYDQGDLVASSMVWFYDICNPPDTVGFPDGCAAKLH